MKNIAPKEKKTHGFDAFSQIFENVTKKKILIFLIKKLEIGINFIMVNYTTLVKLFTSWILYVQKRWVNGKQLVLLIVLYIFYNI